MEEKDIDLVAVAAKLLLFVKNYYKIWLLVSLGGAAVGVIVFVASPKKFQSSMVLSSPYLLGFRTTDLLEDLNRQLEENADSTVANLLQMEVEEVSLLDEIEAEPLITTKEFDQLVALDDDVIYSAFQAIKIKTTVLDNKILPKLQKGLTNYIASQDYVEEMFEIDSSSNMELLQDLQAELNEFDSTQLSTYKKLTQRSSISINPEVASLIRLLEDHEKRIALLEMIAATKKKDKRLHRARVLTPFMAFPKPESPKLGLSIILFSFGGFAIAFVVTSLASVKKSLNSYLDTLKKGEAEEQISPERIGS